MLERVSELVKAENRTVSAVVLDKGESILDLQIGEVLTLWLEKATQAGVLGYCTARSSNLPLKNFYVMLVPAEDAGLWYGISGNDTLHLAIG